MSSIESLVTFVKELNDVSLKPLLTELEKNPKPFTVYVNRTKDDWEKYYGINGVDIFNHLHPQKDDTTSETKQLFQTLTKTIITSINLLGRSMNQNNAVTKTLVETLNQKYEYVDEASSKVTKKSQERSQDFKNSLLWNYYGISKPVEKIFCMVSGTELPSKTIIGSHLFKHCWENDCKERLDFDDINDPRNGMLMFKPFEHAFDRSEICFLKRNDGLFYMEILRPGLNGMTLAEYSQENKFSAIRDIQSLSLSSQTFKDFTTAPINFGEFGFKPFNRCLNFQARQARLYGIKKGWKKMSWDFPDFWSENHNTDNVKCWLNTMDSHSNLFEPIIP